MVVRIIAKTLYLMILMINDDNESYNMNNTVSVFVSPLLFNLPPYRAILHVRWKDFSF